MGDMVGSFMTHIQMWGYFIHCYATIFLHDVFNCCNGLWCHYSVCWPGRGESVTELMPFVNFLVHSYACCSDRHASPYWTFIRRWISMGFTPSILKNPMTECCFFGALCKWGRHIYTTSVPSCRIPASPCHLSATLQIMSIVVFRIFIAFLRFSFDSPSCVYIYIYT